MFNPTARVFALSAAAVAAMAVTGCAVHVYGPPPPAAVVTVGEPVEYAPPPDERVYVYQPGFPPGVYLYNGYYYYGGYRYRRDVFVHRYVDVNIRHHRYMDIRDNRREGEEFERRQREEFLHNAGRGPHRDDHHDEHHH